MFRSKRVRPSMPYAVAAPPQKALVDLRVPAPVPGRTKRAVLVSHGMGQQTRFETLVCVAEALERIDAGRRKAGVEDLPPCVAASVEVGDQRLERLELHLDCGQEVHLYEAYWAPITEGRVTLRDVMSFLLRAGLNGFRNGFERLYRWVFGYLREYPVPASTPIYLLVALSVIGALTAINAVIVMVAAARPILGGDKAWLTPDFLAELSALMNCEVVAAVLFGLTLLASATVGKKQLRRALNRCARITFWVFVATTALVALALGVLFSVHGQATDATAGTAVLAWLRPLGGWPWLRFALWPALLFTSELVRRLLVQYVGDVAVYVSSNRLDRFDDMRTEIRDRVHGIARAIYALRGADGQTPAYDEVAIVGHSLGSVIVYDCLNRLLNDDDLHQHNPGPVPTNTAAQAFLDVGKRTNLLLTFGSPLDKTAYVFGTRGDKWVHASREALAASIQPLIQAQRFRSFPWVNVYSGNDIISGRLDFYDLPKMPDAHPTEPPAHPVENVEDTDATTWLAAHTEYWTTTIVWERLYEALAKSPRPPLDAARPST